VSGPALSEGVTQVSASEGLGDLLQSVGASLALSSYGTGQLILIGRKPDGTLAINQQNFDHAMGLAWRDRRLLLGSRTQLWRFEDLLEPGETGNGVHDAVLVPRIAFTVGDLDLHEVGLGDGGTPLFVSSLYNCLGTPDPKYSFQALWKPPFISEITRDDRCHLNGVAMAGGIPRYVTAIGASDTGGGWRDHRNNGGILLSVPRGDVIASGLSMPHSPRIVGDHVMLIESGRGALVRVDAATGKKDDIAFCPGFARGLSIIGDVVVITLSLPREISLRDIPLGDELSRRDAEPRCGLLFIDLRSGQHVGWLTFEGRITELFDVVWLPAIICPTALGIGTDEVRGNIRVRPNRLINATCSSEAQRGHGSSIYVVGSSCSCVFR
jgi:uncharacterized protein (TIGR03032 family)